MVSKERIRVGLIGANLSYSWGAKAHAPAFLALPEYELAAVATAHAETARATAEHFGIPRAFHDYREMVQSPDIDMVVVSVRVPFHHEMTIAALEAGKHVFCEWPLGANLLQAQEMTALAKAKGLSHMVGLQTRCAPAVMRLKELVEEGYVGDVLSCHVTHILPGVLERPPYWADLEADPKKGANTLTIHAGHTLDALCFCVAEFQELSAQLSTQVKRWRITGTDDFIETSTPDNVMVQGRADERRSGIGPRGSDTVARRRVAHGDLRPGGRNRHLGAGRRDLHRLPTGGVHQARKRSGGASRTRPPHDGAARGPRRRSLQPSPGSAAVRRGHSRGEADTARLRRRSDAAPHDRGHRAVLA